MPRRTQWKYTSRYGLYGFLLSLIGMLLWAEPLSLYPVAGGLEGLLIGYFRDTAADEQNKQRPSRRRYVLKSGLKGVFILLTYFLIITWGILLLLVPTFGFGGCAECGPLMRSLLMVTGNAIETLTYLASPFFPFETYGKSLLLWLGYLATAFSLGAAWGLTRSHLIGLRA